MSTDTLDHAEMLIGRLERLGKLLVGALVLIISGAVWATRQEMNMSEHDRRLTDVEKTSATLNTEVSEIKGRLHGIASQVGKMPSRVAQQIKDGAE